MKTKKFVIGNSNILRKSKVDRIDIPKTAEWTANGPEPTHRYIVSNYYKVYSKKLFLKVFIQF